MSLAHFHFYKIVFKMRRQELKKDFSSLILQKKASAATENIQINPQRRQCRKVKLFALQKG